MSYKESRANGACFGTDTICIVVFRTLLKAGLEEASCRGVVPGLSWGGAGHCFQSRVFEKVVASPRNLLEAFGAFRRAKSLGFSSQRRGGLSLSLWRAAWGSELTDLSGPVFGP